MKLIAITPDYDENTDKLQINKAYIDLVERNGAIPVILPFNEKLEVLSEYADIFDGFIISGGADISPRFYGQDKNLECGFSLNLRDELEYNLVKILYDKNIPTLGICRGMQIMNVALGGTLHQDLKYKKNVKIKHNQDKVHYDLVHKVKNENKTYFQKLFKEDFYVNSLHHQAIDKLSNKLTVGQISNDGVIEGVYADGKRFFVGVQWHPEKCPVNMKEVEILMEDFISKC